MLQYVHPIVQEPADAAHREAVLDYEQEDGVANDTFPGTVVNYTPTAPRQHPDSTYCTARYPLHCKHDFLPPPFFQWSPLRPALFFSLSHTHTRAHQSICSRITQRRTRQHTIPLLRGRHRQCRPWRLLSCGILPAVRAPCGPWYPRHQPRSSLLGRLPWAERAGSRGWLRWSWPVSPDRICGAPVHNTKEEACGKGVTR